MTSRAGVASERLNRFLARRGVASRRGADALIVAGRVHVNGNAAQVGASIDPNADHVEVDGLSVGSTTPAAVTLALNKPVGVVSTARDPQGRPTVMQHVPELPGLVPVGRLDTDSRGLLLLSTDGELAHRVAHPRHGLHKRYRVRVDRILGDEVMRRWLDGVELHDGIARVLEVQRDMGDPTVIELVMGEGRKREVRRIVNAVGGQVRDLCRTAVGPVELGDLPEGATRRVEAGELAALRASVALGEAMCS